MNASDSGFQELARSAGILLHITSVPSSWDIGDLGTGAYRFIDFLHAGGQRLWQILPVNPTTAANAHSPYSAVSSFAGNSLLISPEMLAADGLLDQPRLSLHRQERSGAIDFARAGPLRMESLKLAYDNYLRQELNPGRYREFCDLNKYWLDDFASFTVIRFLNNDRPWYEWPEEIKVRDREVLLKIEEANSERIDFVKWQQFIFDKQWSALKVYARQAEVKLIGDMPIYTAYDSADVWANQRLFNLDKEGRQNSMAGTPPDKFNPNGQQWGMPVYRWAVMKAENFDWFVSRVEKSLAAVDYLRLDHFRGFSAFWEIESGATSAKSGKWVAGPGAELFDALQRRFPKMPFIAEDLGHIDAGVYALRDQFGLPGMEVLEFAFPKPVEPNVHISHNHLPNSVVYTGTHDTDTLTGWFKSLPAADRQSVNDYSDGPVNEFNVAETFSRVAYRSVSKLCVIPLQDLLGLDEKSRMNDPASAAGNWIWRAPEDALSKALSDRLSAWCLLFERTGVAQTL